MRTVRSAGTPMDAAVSRMSSGGGDVPERLRACPARSRKRLGELRRPGGLPREKRRDVRRHRELAEDGGMVGDGGKDRRVSGVERGAEDLWVATGDGCEDGGELPIGDGGGRDEFGVEVLRRPERLEGVAAEDDASGGVLLAARATNL